MHRTCEKDLVDERFNQAEHSGKLAAVIADALHVSAGVIIFVFRRARHRKNGFQTAFLKIGGAFKHSLFQHVVVIPCATGALPTCCKRAPAPQPSQTAC